MRSNRARTLRRPGESHGDLRRHSLRDTNPAMSVEELALRLPRHEKLRLMDTLWADLSDPPEGIDSPAWHEGALNETEELLAQGKVRIFEWEKAKEQLIAER